MKLVTNRDCVVTTNKGHVIAFKKDKPREVPPLVVAECMALGAVPAEGEDKPKISDAAAKEAAAPAPEGVEREKIIIEAMERLVVRNTRGDFSGTGLPNVKALKELVNFEVDPKERNSIWDKVKADIA